MYLLYFGILKIVFREVRQETSLLWKIRPIAWRTLKKTFVGGRRCTRLIKNNEYAAHYASDAKSHIGYPPHPWDLEKCLRSISSVMVFHRNKKPFPP